LSAALNSPVPENRNVSLLKRILDGVGECYLGSQRILEERLDDVALVENRVTANLEEPGRRLLPTGQAPVLILDDFNEDHTGNRCFIYELAMQANLVNQVVFVLTHNQEFANALVRINRWEKIVPLDGIYDSRAHKKELLERRIDPRKAFDDFRQIHSGSNYHWIVEMLKNMLISKFPQLQSMPMSFLHQGMNPSEAIKKAAALLARVH
jgi:hypothetical protein